MNVCIAKLSLISRSRHVSESARVPLTSSSITSSVPLMQSTHLYDDDSASNSDGGSEQLKVPQGAYQRILTSALGVIQDVYHSATRPPTPSHGVVSEGYRCGDRSREFHCRLSVTAIAHCPCVSNVSWRRSPRVL
jgi:hypothetical protein